MANKYFTHIMVLLCLCCAVNAHAQTDSSSSAQDSVIVDSSIAPGDKNNNESYESPGNNNEVDKFSKKNPVEQQRIINERSLSPARVQGMKKGKEFWYADKPGDKKQEDTSEKKGFWYYFLKLITSSVWRFVFWAIVIGAFLLVVILYLRTFTAGSRKLKGQAITAEPEQENIFAANFDEQLNKALNNHNYRLATRLLFLRVLRTMAENSIINYGQDKTNMDYIFELGNTKYAKDFMQASRTYEYVWYGNFDIQQTQFLHVRRQLDDLNQKISN